MDSSSKLLLGATMVLLGLLGLTVAPATQAQASRPTVRCESINGKFSRCPVPWRDAELTRQESKGACVRGQSWGIDRQGLWVDRGCRGLFADVGRGGFQPGPDWNRSISLQCRSSRQRYQMCQVDVGRQGSVRLVKQTSDARCREGESWGWNRAGVWVDHGCSGQFVVDRRR